MASYLINCVSDACGAVKKASFEIVRAVREKQRQARRNVVRPSVFRSIGFRSTPPVCTVTTPAPSFSDLSANRKRKYEGDNDRMTTKRPRFARPPWDNEPWAREGKETLPVDTVEQTSVDVVQRPIYPPLTYDVTDYQKSDLAESIRRNRKLKRRPRKKFKTFPSHSKPHGVAKSTDRKRSISPRIHLTQSPKHQREFLDSDIEQTPSPKKQPVALDEAAPPKAQIVEEKKPSPPPQTDIVTASTEDDDGWDANDDPIFRKTLRAMPECCDEKGFRMPIFGIVSPETQKWNINHAEELAKEEEAAEALAVTDTPSRIAHPLSMSQRVRNFLPSWNIPNRDLSDADGEFTNETTTTNPPTSAFEAKQNELFQNAQEIKHVSETYSPMRSAIKQDDTPSPKPEVEEEEPSTPTRTGSTSAGDVPVKKEDDISKDAEKTETEIKTIEVKIETEGEILIKPTLERLAQDIQQTPQQNKAQTSDYHTPISQMYKLHLFDDDEDEKPTPKAREFNRRSTRAQTVRKEREAAKDLYRLVPLGPEWIKKVKDAAVHGVRGGLNSYDFARAVPQFSADPKQDNWLNDEIINAYLEIIAKHGRQSDREGQVPTHHAFNSYFYSKLDKEGPTPVTRWSRRAKISGKALLETEKVFIPINEGAHWKLCVLEAKKHKKISVYNSMGTFRGQQVCEKVLSWVEKELGKDFDRDEWTLDPAGYSSQQTNSDDCGVFTITTARQIMLGKMGTIEPGKKFDAYPAAIIPIQRQRVVAEIINKGLLTEQESKT